MREKVVKRLYNKVVVQILFLFLLTIIHAPYILDSPWLEIQWWFDWWSFNWLGCWLYIGSTSFCIFFNILPSLNGNCIDFFWS